MFNLNKKSSPVVSTSKPISLSFPEVMNEVVDGKKVTRIEWNNPEEYGLLKDGWLTIHTKGKDCIWKVGDGDLVSSDWVVIPE